MGECWARARAQAPSKTSWARARARALRYQRDSVQKTRPEKKGMSSFRNCMSFCVFFNNVFLEPSKKTHINEIYNFPVASCQDLSWRPHW